MPSTRELTIKHISAQWDQEGGVVSRRSAKRRRPLAYELGRVLLALAGAETGTDEDRRPGALAAGDLACQAGLSDHERGVALRVLQARGCVVRERIPSGTPGTEGTAWRRAYGFHLAPASALRGRGRMKVAVTQVEVRR